MPWFGDISHLAKESANQDACIHHASTDVDDSFNVGAIYG